MLLNVKSRFVSSNIYFTDLQSCFVYIVLFPMLLFWGK